ncbi:MAG: signal peptidase II [Desulfovibrio sp.]|nr:MAG: signal peptidase II [Desulfovibrio sp.]
MGRRFRIVLPLAAVIVVLDQVTKYIITQALPLGGGRVVIDGFFNLVHVLNTGAAFSFLADQDGEWRRWLFVGLSCLAVVLIIYLVRLTHKASLLLLLGFGSVLGGAVGNLVDRVRTGEVVDFLDFYLGSNHWPAFNVADTGISVGAAALILAYFRMPKETTDDH